MLSPALLRLCCLAVMAPALTKAVRQPGTLNFLLMDDGNENLLPVSTPLPFVNDRSADENQLGELHRTTNGCGLSNGALVSNGDLWPTGPYSGGKLVKKTNHIALNEHTNLFVDTSKTVNNVNGHCYPQSVGAPTPTYKNYDLNSTMSESSVNQENMGLINANTSLDCDFQGKNYDSQLSSPLCAEELSHESEHLEDILDKCPTSPPLSPPGSPKSASGESTSTVTAHNPPVVTFVELEEAKNTHERCTTRAKDLLLRLRKLQILQIDKHVAGQIKSLYSHYQKVFSIPCQQQVKHNVIRRGKDPVDLKAEFLQSEDVRNLSTAALVSLVRKLESSNSASNLLPNRSSLSQVEDSLSSEKVNVKLNSRDCAQIKQVTGSLLMRVKHLETVIDSDATDSSSGGESCDEYEDYDEKKTNSTPIHKRALWTWVFDRAPIAKRWTWLQSQVQDLEYRVRQITDLLAQARNAKGTACFEEVVVTEPSPAPSTADNSLTVKKPLRAVNGYVDHNSLVTSSDFHGVPNISPSSEMCLDKHEKIVGHLDDCNSVSRTRPFKNEAFRKRKLLYTAGLHYVSRKAARLSTVKCGCNSRFDVMPCILCCGRYNNTQSVDPNVMPLLERVALLEPSYHPVLSFEKDIPLSLHFENHLKTNETYYCVSKPGPVPIKKTHLGMKPRGIMDHARHHSRKLTRHAAQTLLSSARYRNNRNISSKLRSRGLVFARWKELQKGSFKNKHLRRWSAASSCNSSRQGSPVHNPAMLDDGRENAFDMRKRRDGHQYDIDNIVIPYNIKTASSFQKLQYKEIVTPKWRYLDEELESGPLLNEGCESNEDISDETVGKRHERLEIAERKIVRGGGSTNLNSARRVRRNFRHDSRADSSGANTPDHLSMYHQDIMFQDSNSFISGGPASPALSPPATPGSVNAVSDDSQPSCSNVSAPCPERRRTISLTKRDRLADDAMYQPYVQEDVDHPPFETRSFPLSDQVWEAILQETALMESLPDEEPEREDETFFKEPSSPECAETSSSTSSALEEEEDDTADPEWTVVRRQNGPDRTLVIKLAKR